MGNIEKYYDNGILCGDNTPFSPLNMHSLYIMGIMNSVISKFYMSVFNPTLAAQSGSVRQIPIIVGHKDIINSIISDINSMINWISILQI